MALYGVAALASRETTRTTRSRCALSLSDFDDESPRS